MANQDVNKKQNMQDQKQNQKGDKSGSSKEFTSTDKMRDSDISKQSGQQGGKSNTREESNKRK